MPTQSKQLIFMVCFGDAVYKQMATNCIQSLVSPGNFGGDIVVLTDNSTWDFGSRAKTIAVNLPPDILEIKKFKTQAAKHINLKEYDKVLGMDIDMVAIRDVSPLFDFDDKALHVMEEYPHIRMNAESCGGKLSFRNRLLGAFYWGKNSGLFCAKSDSFERYMQIWDRAIAQKRKLLRKWKDQPVLNYLILRGDIPCIVYPREYILMPNMFGWFGGEVKITKNTIILHHCEANKHIALENLQRALAASASETARAAYIFALSAHVIWPWA